MAKNGVTCFIFASILSFFGISMAYSQPAFTKSVRIITSEAGGIFDLAMRTLAQEIAPALGQPVIVENISSAVLGQTLARAAPDGYTLGMGATSIWVTPIFQKTSYDPVTGMSAVTTVVTYPHILVVHPSVPVKSVKELIALAKARPGVLNIGASASPGGGSFLGAELFKAMAGVTMVRVGYKGNPSALIAMLGGEIEVMFNDLSLVAPHIKSGKLRALAVNSLKPSPLAPGLPTVAATLPGFDSAGLGGIFAPGGTPASMIARLNQEIARALNKPEVREKLLIAGMEAVSSSPEQFQTFIKADIVKWTKVLKDAGVKFES